MRLTATGKRDAVRLAYALREARQTGLTRELNKGMDAAGKVIADAVTDPASTAGYLPKGYEPPFDRTVKAKVEKRLIQGHRVTVVVWADGKANRRDIEAINKGILKHPVHGRYRRLRDGSVMRNPWVTQHIRPGLVDEPARQAMPKAIQKVDDAVARVVAQIEKAG